MVQNNLTYNMAHMSLIL